MTDETTTIPEFLAARPDEDCTDTWERCWAILGRFRERIEERFAIAPHPSSAGFASWSSADGGFGGSLNTYSGTEAEWVVHSWAGNPRQSILDMNLQVWLGPHIDVPHLVIVFGTIPRLFHYSDLIARRDVMVDPGYLERYYGEENAEYLAFRGDSRFTWSVSHGAYMRAVLSPAGHSYTAERTTENLDAVEDYVTTRFDRWMSWVDRAEPVPATDRPALAERDHLVRRYSYTLDPMNALARRLVGDDDLVDRLVDARYGREQMEAR